MRARAENNLGAQNWTRTAIVPITQAERLAGSRSRTRIRRSGNMGKGNNSQKNDKKTMKPATGKLKTAGKK
jgi:hypothetical protein